MASEKEWVDTIVPALHKRIQAIALADGQIGVEAGKKLPYAFEVLDYSETETGQQNINRYETDILIYDAFADGRWIPRVVIECKLGSITTHDALTYSAKASTHKNVHPYLRYGILLGSSKHLSLPPLVIRHGAHFDFMASWLGETGTDDEWHDLLNVLIKEVKASRDLQDVLTDRSSTRTKYTILHRQLQLKKKD